MLRAKVSSPALMRSPVERLVADVRVVDGRGRPVLGLVAGDFRVKVGGTSVPVESAHWRGIEAADALDPDAEVVVTPEAPREPRLVVFLLQKDLQRSRIGGLLRMTEKISKSMANSSM